MKAKVVFALAIATVLTMPPQTRGAKCKVLHSFNSGYVPSGSLLLNKKGKLFGGTYSSVFELIPQPSGRWKKVVLHNFATQDGNPWGALIFDREGNLYGTTSGGPVSNSEVYELHPVTDGWVFSALYTDGAGPGVLLDNAGNIYGEMGPGANKYYGAIAELFPGANGWDYTALYSSCSQDNCADGFALPAPPVWDDHGNMFGVTTFGEFNNPQCWNGNGCGVVFEMTPNGDGTWDYYVLHRFASSQTDGQSPQGGLVRDAAGNFYGTTAHGGPHGHKGGAHGNGIVFKLSPNATGRWTMTVIYDFPDGCGHGCEPFGDLAFDQAGNLYGANGGGNATCSGGAYFCGMIYKLTPQPDGTWKYGAVYKFNGPDGFGPLGVTLDKKGHIYGATTEGGKYNFGVAFEIIP
ncbi:MAG TPA: choice-of-anchor tandem repeat GloVer-containing protein [Terriglobia bacterium]|nr:choice-of-anchor tandem repeat GloVer-containing protein [Terriglobia bacterium]